LAISSGVHPHQAWLSVNGTLIPLLHGSCEQAATRKSSTFSGTVPLNYPGAQALLAGLGDNASGVVVQSNGMGPTPLVMGEIDNTSFDYGRAGTINVSGRCNSSKLHNKKINQKFINQPTTSIVSQLAGMAGLGISLSGGAGHIAGKEMNQEFAKMTDGQSLASVITKCAEYDCARWWVDASSILHYDILPKGGGGYSVTYVAGPPESADFLSLTVKRNVQAGKTVTTQVKSWHTKSKQAADATATAPGKGGPIEYKFTIPGLHQDEAQNWAKSKGSEVARHEITVTAKVVGDTSINVQNGLTVSGTGFDGSYVIDSVHHQFGMSGHTMTITARNGSRTAS
jgi:hypothetical protein